MRAEQFEPFELDPIPGGADVMHSFWLDRSHTVGRGEIEFGVAAVADLNRDFHHDAFNVRTSLGYRLVR
jgi:hypothetical protein